MFQYIFFIDDVVFKNFKAIAPSGRDGQWAEWEMNNFFIDLHQSASRLLAVMDGVGIKSS